MKKVVLNLDYCISCKSCTVASYISHNKRSLLNCANPIVKVDSPVHCRHCEKPLCVEVCPEDAIKKTKDGIVITYSNLCIGCKSCTIACPFGAIKSVVESYITQKCDLCIDNLKRGEIPDCVATCTSGALQFMEVDGLSDRKVIFAGHEMVSRLPLRRR